MKSNLIVALNAIEKHDVELATMQDIDKLTEQGKKSSQSSFDSLMKVKTSISDSIGMAKLSIKQYEDALRLATDTQKKIKEIGLPENEILDKIKFLNNYISKSNDSIKNAEKAIAIL